MSTFITEMDQYKTALEGLILGENGMPEHKTTSSAMYDFILKLVRNIPDDDLTNMFNNILCQTETSEDANLLADIIVVMFKTRDVRGGKGEKLLFYKMFLEFFKKYPITAIALLSEIADYGYYKDFMNIYDMPNSLPGLKICLIQVYAKQLRADAEALRVSIESDIFPAISIVETRIYPKISLAAKFAPRQGKNFATFHKKLVKVLYPESKTPDKDFRKMIVSLTKALEITEVFMCANRYHEINFKKVPSLCLNKHRMAFLNQIVTQKGRRQKPLTGVFRKLKTPSAPHPGQALLGAAESEMETGNRFPDDLNRVDCRKNLLLATAEGKVCGKVLAPHELVRQLMSMSSITHAESCVYDAQWEKIQEGVLEVTEKFLGHDSPNGLNFGKLLSLVDVSASMEGTPMEVAIALGILVSMTCDLVWRNRIITFETNPSWIDLSDCPSLFAKVKKTLRAPWGGSTDLEKAFEMILKVACDAKLTPDQIPDLIIFSDMQFNEAGSFGETMFMLMTRRFAEEGMKICGSPWQLPKIIFWNLRGDTQGYPVDENQKNVQMLSGFSPSLLKLLLSGEPLVNEVIDENGTMVKQQINPAETLRKALDDSRYFPIRKILSESVEGLLKKYVFKEGFSTDENM